MIVQLLTRVSGVEQSFLVPTGEDVTFWLPQTIKYMGSQLSVCIFV